MRRATAWSVRGVDRSTQEIAEEAARRAGMSLGDWLDAVVAERAAEHGLASDDLGEDDKLDAIGERLSRLARRDDNGSRRRAEERPPETPPPREHPSPEEARVARERLEAAIAKFESRATKNEERTAKAFESVASWIERSQADRLQERETLQSVAEKLDAIETRARHDAEKLRAATAAEQRAREEAMQSQIDARLDALARRVAAAERAPARAAPSRVEPETPPPSAPREPAAPMSPPPRRESDADERLAELTRRVEAAERARVEPSPPATRAKLDVREAVEQIARRRVETAPRPAARAEPKAPPPAKSGWRRFGVDVEPERSREPAPPASSPRGVARPAVEALREQMAALEARLAKLRAPRADPRPAASEAASLKAGLASMSRSVADIAPRNAAVALEGAVDDLGQRLAAARQAGANEALLAPIEAMTRQVLEALRERDPRAVASAVEREIRALGAKIDALAGARVDPDLLERIRRQSDETRSLLASAAMHPAPFEKLERRIGQLADRVETIASSPAPRAEIAQILRLLSETHAQIEQSTPAAVLEAIERNLGQLAERIDDALRRPAPAIDPRPIEDLAHRIEGLRATIERRADGPPDLAPLEHALREINAKLDRAPEGAIDSRALMSTLRAMNARLEETLRQPRLASLDPKPIDDLARRIDGVRATVERKADFAPHAARLEAAIGDLHARLDAGGDPRALAAALQAIDARLDESLRQPRVATVDSRPLEDLARRIDGVRSTVERKADFAPHAARLEAALGDLRSKLDAGGDPRALAATLQAIEARLDESLREPRVATVDPKPLEDLARRIDGVRATVERKADFAPHAARLEAALGDLGAKLARGGDAEGIASALQGLSARLDEFLREPRVANVDPAPLEDLARRIDGVRATVERKSDFAPHAARIEAALGDLGAKLDRPPAREPNGLNGALRDLAAKLDDAFRRPTVASIDPRPLDDLGRRIDEMRASVERQVGAAPDVGRLEAGLRDIAVKLDRLAESPTPLDPRPLEQLARRVDDARATMERQANRGIDASELKAALGEIAGKLDRQAAAPPSFDSGKFDEFSRRFDDVHAALAEHARRSDTSALESTLRDLAAKLERQAASPARLDTRPLDEISRQIETVRATLERQSGRALDASELKTALSEIDAKLDRQASAPVMLDARPLEELARGIDDVRAALERQPDPRADLPELQAALREIGDKLDRHAETTHHVDPWAIDDIVRRIDDVRAALEHRAEPRPDSPELTRALRDIGDKLDRQAASPVELDPRPLEDLASRIDHVRAALERQADPRPDIARLDDALREISVKLDRHAVSADESRALLELMRELAERVEAGAASGVDAAALERIVRDLGERPVEIDTRPFESLLHDLGDRIAAIPTANFDIEPIERMLAQVDAKLDEMARSSDTRSLELAIHDLKDRLSRLPEPVLDASLVEHAADVLAQRLERRGGTALDTEALVNQISDIHGRLDSFDIASSSNAALERAVTELIEELETTREVLQSTSGQPSALAPLIGGISELRAEQAVSDRRMDNRLSSVQAILEKLSDRLARVEEQTERDDGRDASAAPGANFAASARSTASRPATGATGRSSDFRDIPDREPREAANPAAPPVRPVRGDDVLLEPGSGAPGRNAAINAHIAAARRAAQSAMAEHADKEPKPSRAVQDAKPGLRTLAQARAMLAKRRRPILLGATAAALTVAATVALMELRGGGHSRPEQKSDLAEPTADSSAAIDSSGPETAAKPAGSLDYRPTGAVDPIPAKPAAAPAKPAPGDLVAALPATLPEALRDAATAGDAGAETELALRYLDGRTVARDAKLASRWFDLAANQGLAVAQYRLAALYEKGTGVARDLNLARAWYLKSASAGNARAMHNLAVLYAQDGGAGKPDYAEAAAWFRRAAELGIRDSQFNLAVLSGRGLGMPQDLASSWMWFSLASQQGDADAAKKRDEVAAKMDAATLAAARKALADFKAKPLDPKANEAPAPAGGWDAKPVSPQAARPSATKL